MTRRFWELQGFILLWGSPAVSVTTALLKQTAIRQSEQVIALMDSSKIDVKCSFSFCGLSDIDIVVSDGSCLRSSLPSAESTEYRSCKRREKTAEPFSIEDRPY